MQTSIILPTEIPLSHGLVRGYPIVHIPPSVKQNSMPEVTIRSADPVQMYWRMVFYGAADPDSELIINSKDEKTGIFTVSLKMD